MSRDEKKETFFKQLSNKETVTAQLYVSGLLMQVGNGMQVKTIKSWSDNEIQVTESNGGQLQIVKRWKIAHRTQNYKI